jgi:hypothetical protein
MSRKPTLIRPITSLSLVELAQSESDDEEKNLSSLSLRSMPLSPIGDLSTERSESPLTTPSPWGHFVELLVPAQNVSNNSTKNNPHHYHQETCNCCSTCRRRRSSPYGDYSKNKQRCRPLAFLQDGIQTFRLTAPSKDKPTEQLISGLVHMRVDC